MSRTKPPKKESLSTLGNLMEVRVARFLTPNWMSQSWADKSNVELSAWQWWHVRFSAPRQQTALVETGDQRGTFLTPVALGGVGERGDWLDRVSSRRRERHSLLSPPHLPPRNFIRNGGSSGWRSCSGWCDAG